ncbi:TetR/AcrR family transcriptional regulator [Streptosporangium sp. KLBMP 9127]|nr:TetR/AcrR family transcriptional regulator [Streptosporangium sp. KLBMP 9127]
MARPRKFDEERAVDAAMRAFWAAGYEATSTEDLCEATGLGRSSIYNTFTSKRALFLRALRHYAETMTERQVELLEGDAPVREKLRELLSRVVDEESGDPQGCLVVNTSIELAGRDEEVAALLKRDYDRRIEALRTALETGRSRGELDAGRDPLALAHFVAATVGGLRVAARTGADRAALDGIAASALAAL